MESNEIQNLLNNNDYDIRKSGNARWIDQKCTPDVVSIISDCICDYIEKNGTDCVFTSRKIWDSDYSGKVIEMYFDKPHPKHKSASNEYDKFFAQPLEMLAYSKVIKKCKKGNRNFYQINNLSILEHISQNDKNAFNFIRMYIEKVLKDSDIFDSFEKFYINEDKNSFDFLKSDFEVFTKTYTPINNTKEVYRIFTKIINPLSCYYKKLGTYRGRLSKEKITYSDLLYNQKNFRDIYVDKPKGVTRKEWYDQQEEKPEIEVIFHKSEKAKRYIKRYNDKYRDGYTEVYGKYEGPGDQIHHIFPISQFKQISYFYENLVALSPTQHLSCAHPHNNTQKIDVRYQKIILLEKIKRINENIRSGEIETIYSYKKFVEVINEGLNKNYDITEEYNLRDAKSIINESYELY